MNSEIQSHLEFSFVVDEQVLRFEIAVQDPAPVAVGESAQQLEQEDLDVVHAQNVAAVVYVLPQILLQALEHQSQRLVRVHDVVQRH